MEVIWRVSIAKSQKKKYKCLIPIFGFQGEAINTEGLLKVLYFISGL
jgi:hypothetical protein